MRPNVMNMKLFLVQPRVITDPKVTVNVLNLVAFHCISVINVNPFSSRTSTLLSQFETIATVKFILDLIGVCCLYDYLEPLLAALFTI